MMSFTRVFKRSFKIYLLLLLITCFVFSGEPIEAQTSSPDSQAKNQAVQSWETITTRNNEFAISMLSEFQVYNHSEPFYLKDGGAKFLEEHVVTGYLDRVVMVVTVSRVSNPSQGLNELLSTSYKRMKGWQDINLNGFKGKHYQSSERGYYRDIQLFVSKEHIYGVEVAAKDAENPVVKKFLSSLRLGKDAVAQAADVAAKETAKTQTQIQTQTLLTVDGQPLKFEDFKDDNPKLRKAIIIFKPSPFYTDDARQHQTTGTVLLKMVLSATGMVTDIEIVDGLGHGLSEKAIEAAKLIRFLPAEKDGRPVSQYVRVEYEFNIY